MLPEAAQMMPGILPVVRREPGENAWQQRCHRTQTRGPSTPWTLHCARYPLRSG